MTNRLGGSGDRSRFNPIGPVQGLQTVGPVDGTGALVGRRPAGPRFASDDLQVSEESRAYYAALIDGADASGVDPELLLHLQVVHGPSSPLFEAMRNSAEGRQRLMVPAGRPRAAEPPPEAAATPMAGFFSRMLSEAGFAWRDFSESQRW